MKSLKLILINTLTLLIGIGIMTGSVSTPDAEAARFENIPAMQAHQLGNYRGQYLTVLYAVGSRPFISKDSKEIAITQVKEARTIYISADTLKLPQVRVEKEGFRPSYNMVLFIVSPNSNFSWINPDGSAPQGMSVTNNHRASLISTINKSEIDVFQKKNKYAFLPVNLKN